MILVWVILGWLWMSVPVWALTESVPARTRIGYLTKEAFALVPTLAGMEEHLVDGTVTFRKDGGGEFTTAEIVLLRQAVAAHDPKHVPDAPMEIPIEDFAGPAALAILAGRGLVVLVKKKKPRGTT